MKKMTITLMGLLFAAYGFGQTNTVITIDFTDPTTSTYGTHAQRIDTISDTDVAMMWCGDANQDGKIIYQGPNSDLVPIIMDILSDPGNTNYDFNYALVSGYFITDLNMDGKVIYQGPNSDMVPLLNSVLGFPGNPYFFFNFSLLIEQIPTP